MATRTQEIFATVRTEGLLLPPELLRRIVDLDSGLDGLTPAYYYLSGERINEAISNAWSRLRIAWSNFKTAQAALPERDAGTTLTRERWLLPLFTFLDYGRLQSASTEEIDGKSYPISHRWGHVPIHLVSYKIDLDKRTPGVAGAATTSPHSMVQTYLNRSTNSLWGFVSNGYRLRILRDNSSLTRQAFVEFNLEAMMESEIFADFALLWMLCHQSRVESEKPLDCWLEKWVKAGEEQGTRALDQLRGSVENAIKFLGDGFIKHPQNKDLRWKLQTGGLHKQDYYRQLLRLVYRLLLLFVAEDRDLLLDPDVPEGSQDIYWKHYSVQRLRAVAEQIRGTQHSDQFEGLCLVMRLVGGYDNGKARLIGLPILGSDLFSDEFVPDIINCKISNYYLLSAVRALAYIEDREASSLRPIDYKHLGPEELGGVYESLLELHPEVNISAESFDLQTAGGHDRKVTGSYYTPASLINVLLDSALQPVLDEARKSHDPAAAILKLKVCDPACGSGSFLIAAAHRMAAALARVRSGGDEPSPTTVRTALRQIIGNCIYGVDINPMSVELCRVNLWIEALDPGKPLSFLDHHIKVGNSLLGTAPALMAKGIPDEAIEVLEGDDKQVTASIRKQNRQERKARAAGQQSMFLLLELPTDHASLTQAVRQLEAIDDNAISGIRAKQERWRKLANDPDYIDARLLADAWCAAFVWDKKPGVFPLTQLVYEKLCQNPSDPSLQPIREHVAELRERYAFFHWHIEFPDVFEVSDNITTAENEQTGWNGGFDVILGNPPWERIKIQEREWFAERDPQITNAQNASERRKLIESLRKSNSDLFAAFQTELRYSEGESHLIRTSGRYPLCGRGDVNTYAIFAELNATALNSNGYAGFIIQSDIATSDTYKNFFDMLLSTRRLARFYDFVNTEGIFPDVHRTHPHFCLITIAGQPINSSTDFSFWNTNVGHLSDKERHFTLTAEDIALINPNTRTSPIFRTSRDAELTKAIYRCVPALMQEEPHANLWDVRFLRMFDMTNDSHLFRTRHQLEMAGYELNRNRFVRDEEVFLPLYEAKLMHHFDHRWATYNIHFPRRLPFVLQPDEAKNDPDKLIAQDITVEWKIDPSVLVMPRYWVAEAEVTSRIGNIPYLIGFRDVTNTTNERTAIFGLLPRVGFGNNNPLILIKPSFQQHLIASLATNLSSFVIDFVARMKLGGTHMNFFLAKQLPVLPPQTYTPRLLEFNLSHVLELTYTAWDMQPFAQDVGWQGSPFVWDEERRFFLRCELDALYFHLYQIGRDDVDYIMETFPIVKRKDEVTHGEYRTKRVILEMYDQMAALPKIAVPHPKGLEEEYLVPDVSLYKTWLTPPPADPAVTHPDKKGNS